MLAPSNWANKKPGVLVSSPGLTGMMSQNPAMTLRDQLYAVKNSVQNKFQLSQVSLSSRGQVL